MITCNLNNETNHGYPQVCVGDCWKAGKKNGAMDCSIIRARKGTYDAVKLNHGERSREIRSYNDVTRDDVQTPLGQNRLMIP